MAKSVKQVFGGMTQGKLFRDSSGEIHPELTEIWKIASSPKQSPGDPLVDGEPVTLLLFRRYETAIWWETMASYGIAIKLYSRLFRKQHGYSFSELSYKPPDRIPTEISMKTSIALTPECDEYHKLQKRYILNDYERSRGWCPFCRGAGYMMVLRAEQELTDNGIPVMPYRMRCVHLIYSEKAKQKAGRPTLMG
ncbi:MAG: hypothetical protein GY839_04860 [candidate division Zixibacteria bacterium]|nr:hypothetical protein [candidate division Zixibacteria bacterium]